MQTENPIEKPHFFLRAPKFWIMLAIANLAVMLAALYLIKYFFIAPPPADTGSAHVFNNTQASSSDSLITKVPRPEELIKEPVHTGNDPVLGDKTASNTIVIFADYACEFCSDTVSALKDLVRQKPGEIKLIWKDYPENDPAAPAFAASLAARCAGEQGKFWEYSSALFALSGSFGEKSLKSLADSLGIDQGKFDACLKDGRESAIIKDNIFEADALMISGLPTIFINGREFLGQMTDEDLREAVKKLVE
jgi:protein-disulfide isomerase